MRKVSLFLWTTLLMLGLVCQAGAYTLDDIEFWVGEGQYEVGFVMDFGDGNSYVWGYRYDQEIVNDGVGAGGAGDYTYTELLYDATEAILAADSDLTAIWNEYTTGMNVDFEDSFYQEAYEGYEAFGYNDLYQEADNLYTYWATSISFDEDLDSASWYDYWDMFNDLMVGEGTKTLPTWIGWAYWDTTTWDDWSILFPPPSGTPTSAQSSVPEPGTFALLGVGLLGLARFAGGKRKIG